MKLLGQVIVLCLALAALQAVLSLMVVAIVLLLVWGLIFRTRETVGLLLVGLFLSALQAHPVVTIGSICALVVIRLMAAGARN